MEITIQNETDNKVLSRKEMTVRIHYEGVTPSRKDVQQAIASKVGAKAPMTVIRTIQNSFGDTAAVATVMVYSDEASMKANERENLLAKHAGHGEEPATEEAPASEEKPAGDAPAAEEAVTEEKKEEAAE